MLRALFCGGGSIGHLAPSLAVFQALKGRQVDAEALFVCSSRRDDRQFLKGHRMKHVPIHAPKITNSWSAVLLPLLFPIACLEALLILLLFRPHVIFAKGGYVSVPVCLVGWILRRPIVLHESDRMMGKANRALLRFARHLCIGAPQKEIADDGVMGRTHIPITATGNPIRPIILQGSADGGRRVTGFSGKRPVLLVIGGSQGAQALNEIVWETLPELLDFCDVIHITGRGKRNEALKHARYFQREMCSEELHHLYALADVVVSRAGAGTIAELSALGKATILVPLPEDVQKHQWENARFPEVAHAAIVLHQTSLRDALLPSLRTLFSDTERIHELGGRLRAFSEPNAAQRIANILLETACHVARGRRGRGKQCMMPSCPKPEPSSSVPPSSSPPAPRPSQSSPLPKVTANEQRVNPPHQSFAPWNLRKRGRKSDAAVSSKADTRSF